MKRKRRKYDTKEHRSARQRLGRDVASGGALCWRCSRPITPGSKWHVGHDDDGVLIMGPEHASCNLSAQNRVRAARARAFTNGGRAVVTEAPAVEPKRAWADGLRPRWSRHWAGDEYDERCRRCYELGSVCEEN